MRDHSKHVEFTRDQALAALLEASHFAPAIETLPVGEAFGRVLAVDTKAQLDMPNCLTCNMDSVAVRWADFEEAAKIGVVPDTSAWIRGVEWEFANTGIGMPEGFDTAIVIEHVTVTEDADGTQHVAFEAPPTKKYAGTTPAGARMHKGDVLVEAGSTLSPLLISLIASGNNTEVQVFAKPVVGFIPTGNELVVPGSDVARGKNIETNSLVAKGKIEGWGGICRVFDIVPDDPEAIRATGLEAARTCDIVVLNAGSSKGNDDWNIEMLEEVGTVLYHETNHGPGHHSSGSVVEGKPVVGISGPPGGAAFTMDFYLYPLMMHWFGLPAELDKLQVRLGKMFPKSGPNPSAGKKPGEDAGKGEVRPTIVTEGKEFFGVKQLQFYQEEDSAELWAMPASSTHAKPVEADTMDCYYLLSSARPAPLYGEILEVDVRP